MKLKIYRLAVGPLQSNCYIITLNDKNCIVIDPGSEGNLIVKFLKKKGYVLDYIINTHGHFDHIGANYYLKRYFPYSKLLIHEKDIFFLNKASDFASEYGFLEYKDSPQPDIKMNVEYMILHYLDSKILLYHTPGHSPGSIVIYFKKQKVLFTGDSLFKESIGNYQLPFSDRFLLKDSLEFILDKFPQDTKIYPGHGLKSSLLYEKKNNMVMKNFFNFL